MVETLVAFITVAFGALAIGSLQSNLYQSKTAIEQKNIAIQFAKNKIEQLRQFSNQTQYDAIISGSDNQTSETTTFDRSWQVTNNLSLYYKHINVSVA